MAHSRSSPPSHGASSSFKAFVTRSSIVWLYSSAKVFCCVFRCNLLISELLPPTLDMFRYMFIVYDTVDLLMIYVYIVLNSSKLYWCIWEWYAWLCILLAKWVISITCNPAVCGIYIYNIKLYIYTYMYIYPNYTWLNTYEPLSHRDAASIEYGSFHLDDLNYFLGKHWGNCGWLQNPAPVAKHWHSFETLKIHINNGIIVGLNKPSTNMFTINPSQT